jgi:hypothetical protein
MYGNLKISKFNEIYGPKCIQFYYFCATIKRTQPSYTGVGIGEKAKLLNFRKVGGAEKNDLYRIKILDTFLLSYFGM